MYNDFGGSIFREWYFMFFVFFSDEGIKYSPKNYSSYTKTKDEIKSSIR